jgi:hypothetical protein
VSLFGFQVFDDVAVEIAMAVLQFFNMKPDEEKLFRCMKALGRFVHVSRLVEQTGSPHVLSPVLSWGYRGLTLL